MMVFMFVFVDECCYWSSGIVCEWFSYEHAPEATQQGYWTICKCLDSIRYQVSV